MGIVPGMKCFALNNDIAIQSQNSFSSVFQDCTYPDFKRVGGPDSMINSISPLITTPKSIDGVLCIGTRLPGGKVT